MIKPINNIDNKIAFGGYIKNSKNLDVALAKFSKKELQEFNSLRDAASRVNDGKLFRVFNSCATRHEEVSSKVFYTHGVGLIDEDNKIFSEEVYEETVSNGRQVFVINEIKESFAKSILEPLRKIYGNKA